ncbi:MAG: hypothetical protein NTW87_13330, partial [Planctomycetota bacterium]|nr:hypothetical protein [Planctomycetota bacterium]
MTVKERRRGLKRLVKWIQDKAERRNPKDQAPNPNAEAQNPKSEGNEKQRNDNSESARAAEGDVGQDGYDTVIPLSLTAEWGRGVESWVRAEA